MNFTQETKVYMGNYTTTFFDLLKQKLIQAPVMSYPMKEGMYILDTDASNYSYGAVLSQMQKDENGIEHERPIAYYSKTFTERETTYCTRQRELLAIINSVKHFNVYLRGITFLIRTDHASLKYIKTVKELPAQFYRWVMYLEDTVTKLKYEKEFYMAMQMECQEAVMERSVSVMIYLLTNANTISSQELFLKKTQLKCCLFTATYIMIKKCQKDVIKVNAL